MKRSANIRTEWALLLANLGGRKLEAVREFDAFTNDMIAGGHISIDEFVSAQAVIGAALAGGRAMARSA